MIEGKLLSTLIKKRHPEYEVRLPHWDFLELCYEGGRDWFEKNIFKYLKEGDVEFKDRVSRAYRFNHSKEVVDLVCKYIFKSKIYRNIENAPQEIIDFWAKTTRNGKSSIEKFIRQVARDSSIYGRIWIIVDNNRIVEDGDLGGREYAYIVKPQHVLDMSYDDDGELNWIMIAETFRDNIDPFSSNDMINSRFRLWTKTNWYLIEKSGKDVVDINGKNLSVIDSGEHALGIVPVFPHDHNDTDELYSSPSLIADIAYLDRACANYLSNLDAIIQDQSFSQLAMPAQNLMPGEEAYNKMLEVGTKRIFLYDGEGGGQPFYLSPDPRQAELIITAIGKIINEIYHTVGMAGERTKQDNSIGIDNSSGVAKAYDFERVNALLTTKAVALKRAEVKMASLALLWNGIVMSETDIGKLITYPETFDVRGISDEFSIAQNLILVESPIEMIRQQMKVLVDKLFPTIDEALKTEMYNAVDKMESVSTLLANENAQQAGEVANTGFKGNKQGENNTDSEA